MAVLVEFISVIVRRDAVESRFVGGIPEFLKTIPNPAACHDRNLIRVGFMDTSDADAYVAALAARGLVVREDHAAADVTMVMQKKGPTIETPWLEYREIDADGKRVSICWLAGQEPGPIAVPDGWTYERSASKNGPGFLPVSAIGDRLKFLRRVNGVEVYLDLQTNAEVFVGRSTVRGDAPEALQTQIDAAWHEAVAIETQGLPRRAPGFWQRLLKRRDANYVKLHDQLLPEIERIARGPGRELAAAHYTLGVIFRLLNRREEAVKAFLTARQLHPGGVATLRDLVRCLGEMGKPNEALPYAREAASMQPTDVAVLGNLAACLMQCGQSAEAATVINRALDLDPTDRINQHIRTMLNQR